MSNDHILNNLRANSPVVLTDTDSNETLEQGLALCLSGGGYRAMLFHLGALWRLNELGYLPKLKRISSVSGGSITAAMLGLRWHDLNFDQNNGIGRNFESEVITPIRKLAEKTIDRGSILGGIFTPGSIGDKVTDAYREHLFEEKTLQDLPNKPRFVINATNVQSGSLWRFEKPYMADYRVGVIEHPNLELAVAVAASSAFPPFLSPVELKLKDSDYKPNSGKDLQRKPFTTHVVLTDGGVYDNLGLETAWKNYDTILVSDGGGKMEVEEDPEHDWARHARRILDLVDNQVRNLRKRQLINSYQQGDRKGAYWSIRSDIKDYKLTDTLDCPFDKTIKLANISTRLEGLKSEIQERLINWGYAVCDTAMRKHVDSTLPAPRGFPYSQVGIG
jgi:NTE family protein